jgi:hypothetical protein
MPRAWIIILAKIMPRGLDYSGPKNNAQGLGLLWPKIMPRAGIITLAEIMPRGLDYSGPKKMPRGLDYYGPK